MQLLPSTAADKAVGIPDVPTPENNIHAGVRYLEQLGSGAGALLEGNLSAARARE